MLDTDSGGKAAHQAHHLVLDEQDLAYEEEILRNPNSIKPWIRYIEHKADAPKNILNLVFERALKELPGSYKLWYNYLKVRFSLFLVTVFFLRLNYYFYYFCQYMVWNILSMSENLSFSLFWVFTYTTLESHIRSP